MAYREPRMSPPVQRWRPPSARAAEARRLESQSPGRPGDIEIVRRERVGHGLWRDSREAREAREGGTGNSTQRDAKGRDETRTGKRRDAGGDATETRCGVCGARRDATGRDKTRRDARAPSAYSSSYAPHTTRSLLSPHALKDALPYN